MKKKIKISDFMLCYIEKNRVCIIIDNSLKDEVLKVVRKENRIIALKIIIKN